MRGHVKQEEIDDNCKNEHKDVTVKTAASISLPMFVAVDQSNYKSISVKLGDIKDQGE